MSLWIKICGLTTAEAVQAAVDAAVDAVGFVFTTSVRQVKPQQAAELARALPTSIQRVAVTRHPSQELIDEIYQVFRPDILQTDSTDLQRLSLPHTAVVLPVYRNLVSISALPPRLLFEGCESGTGEVADWSAASRLASATKLVLAGGLNAANVAAAIHTVRPFGVDVSSGVERQRGSKDPSKIREFVTAARAALAADVQHEHQQ